MADLAIDIGQITAQVLKAAELSDLGFRPADRGRGRQGPRVDPALDFLRNKTSGPCPG